MTSEQRRFLEGEFLTLSIGGAFQRSSTYATEDEKDRDRVRFELRSLLSELATRYSSEISGEAHIENIQELAKRMKGSCAPFLNGDHLRIGIAQKALNLYLKYLWCADLIPPPPHCPFDDNVINVRGKLRLPPGCERRWTQADDLEHYRRWVEAATEEAQKKDVLLPIWELQLWNASQRGCPQTQAQKPPGATAQS